MNKKIRLKRRLLKIMINKKKTSLKTRIIRPRQISKKTKINKRKILILFLMMKLKTNINMPRRRKGWQLYHREIPSTST